MDHWAPVTHVAVPIHYNKLCTQEDESDEKETLKASVMGQLKQEIT